MCVIKAFEFLDIGPQVLTQLANAKRQSTLIMKLTLSIRQEKPVVKEKQNNFWV